MNPRKKETIFPWYKEAPTIPSKQQVKHHDTKEDAVISLHNLEETESAPGPFKAKGLDFCVRAISATKVSFHMHAYITTIVTMSMATKTAFHG